MAAGSKEKELEDTLPGADEMEVSAEASELRRRLLAVGSNDNAERQRNSAPPAGEQTPADGRALRATLQFVRRRPAGNEEVTVTAVSGAPLPARDPSAPQGEGDSDEAEARPSRARIVVPLVAGALLVLVALIHRTLSHSSEPAPASSLAAPKAAGLLVPPPRPDVPAPRRVAPSTSAKVAGGASTGAVPSAAVPPAAVSSATSPSPAADPPRSPGDEAARLLATARSKAQRSNRTPAPRETPRASEASGSPSSAVSSSGVSSSGVSSSGEPAVNDAPKAEPAPTAKPRPRLVDDAPRPGLLD